MCVCAAAHKFSRGIHHHPSSTDHGQPGGHRAAVAHDYGMNARLPSMLTTADFSEAELSALVLDGMLFRVGECFSAADEVTGVWPRAASLATWLPPHLVAERATAAWVWGARNDPPAVHELCVDITARARPVIARRLAVREVVISADDIVTFRHTGPAVRVTTPLRTAVDIARSTARFTESDAECVATLMALGQFDAAACLATMDQRRNLPGKKRAVQRLRHSEHIAATLPRVEELFVRDPLAVPTSVNSQMGEVF